MPVMRGPGLSCTAAGRLMLSGSESISESTVSQRGAEARQVVMMSNPDTDSEPGWEQPDGSHDHSFA